MSLDPSRDRAALLAFIAADPPLAAVLTRVEASQDGDPGHDLGHLLRVALWTLRLGAGAVDRREAIAAALLHDVVNVPKDSPDRARASELCAAVARDLLPGLEVFDDAAVERVSEAIRDHSFSRGAVPAHPLGRALQDADRLEALGVIGLFRCISTGARMGAAYFHPTDPWARDRARDDRAYSVDHFFTKLLRLEATLLTDAGRAEARRRADYLRATLVQLGLELGEPCPPLPRDGDAP